MCAGINIMHKKEYRCDKVKDWLILADFNRMSQSKTGKFTRKLTLNISQLIAII